MSLRELAEICEVNPRRKKGEDLGKECSFIPMEYVDEELGVIAQSDTRLVQEVERGYTAFKENDVIFAKITPCMENGKVALARNLVNGLGFGSTEFHVLRAGDLTIPEWIFYFLRQERVRNEAERQMTGTAGQKRVPTRVMQSLQIPLPPLDEQKRIAAILARADRLRRLTRYGLEMSESYLQAVFVEMFGDPVMNPRGWPSVKLSSIGKLDRGRSRNRPRNAPYLFNGRYPFVQTGDVANADGYITDYHQTYNDRGLKQSKLWPAGTLCITIAANIAKTAILTFDACFPDSVVGFTPNNKTNTEYIQQWFSFIQKILEETAPEVAQKNINLQILRSLDIILPPISLQQRFADIVRRFERVRAQQREQLRQAEHLFGSLLARAFGGGL